MSSAPSGCSCRISDRLNSGATTENDGFSVVAATSSTTRFSTAASSASCWVLEKRCTSSMNRTVCSPLMAEWRAVSMTARTSFTPADSAESASNRRPVAPEMRDASVVFPVPGGPYKMTDAAPEPSTSRRSGEPGLSRCCWPTTSSRVAGRIRTASGLEADGASMRAEDDCSPPGTSKRLSDTPSAYHAVTTP